MEESPRNIFDPPAPLIGALVLRQVDCCRAIVCSESVVMIETREDSVNQYMGASRDLEKSYGICTPEVDPQSLRAPPAALPPRNSYSRGAESVTLQSQEHISTSQASRDPEKASLAHHMQSHQLQSHRTTIASTDEEDCDFGEDNDDPKRHAVWILVSRPYH